MIALAKKVSEREFSQAYADVVICAIPDQLTPWSQFSALQDREKRFPLTPPVDSRVAQFWHGFLCLTNLGRMAVLMPPTALIGPDGTALLRYLIDHNYLQAVVELPACADRQSAPESMPLLLLVDKRKADTRLALIGPERGLSGTGYQDRHVLAAFDDWQGHRSNMHLHASDTSAVAQQGYQVMAPFVRG